MVYAFRWRCSAPSHPAFFFAFEKASERCTHRCVGCEPLADEVQPTGAHELVRQFGCVCIGVGVMEMSAKQCKLSVAA